MSSTDSIPGSTLATPAHPRAPGFARIGHRSRPPLVLLVLGGLTAAVAVIPLVYLVVRVIGAGPEQVLDVLWRARTLQTILTSAAFVVVVTGACLLIGITAAWLITRTNIPGRGLWLVLLALPLAMPSYVAAYAWLAQFPWMNGFAAAALIMILVSFPYVALPTAAAFRLADPGVDEVARSLGRGPFRAFLSATFPQVWPAAAAGGLLVALYTLSEFGVVALMRVDTFTRVIYASYRGSFDRISAAVLALVLVALAAILVWAERRARGRQQRWRVAAAVQRDQVPLVLRPATRAASVAGLVTLVVLALGVPIASLIDLMLRSTDLRFNLAELLSATVSSAGVSLLGAVIAVALALPVGILAARFRTRSVHGIETLSYAGHALPGVVVGLSLVFLTLGVLPFAYQTLFTLAVAYAVLFLPKAIGATRSATAAVPPVLEDTARTLGRGPVRAWLSTTARLTAPGVLAGGLLVLLTSMKELPATLMLRPTGLDTLATELWSRTEVAAYGPAAPYALALIALAAVPAWLLSRAMGPQASGRRGAPDTFGA